MSPELGDNDCRLLEITAIKVEAWLLDAKPEAADAQDRPLKLSIDSAFVLRQLLVGAGQFSFKGNELVFKSAFE